MPDQRTLLQRLQAPGVPDRVAEVEQLARSVRDNLAALFSTQQGSCQAEPEYGFPLLSVLMHSLEHPPGENPYQHSIERIKWEIRTSISSFEPRIRLEQIDAMVDPEDPTKLRFDVRARLLLDGRARGQFQVSAVVTPHGRLELS